MIGCFNRTVTNDLLDPLSLRIKDKAIQKKMEERRQPMMSLLFLLLVLGFVRLGIRFLTYQFGWGTLFDVISSSEAVMSCTVLILVLYKCPRNFGKFFTFHLLTQGILYVLFLNNLLGVASELWPDEKKIFKDDIFFYFVMVSIF